MNRMDQCKRQLLRVNNTSFKLITRLDSEQNESVYHHNKLVSFIEMKSDRTHEFELEGRQYRIYVDSENTVTEVLVNGEPQNFACDEVKVNLWIKLITGIGFLMLLLIPIFVDKSIRSEHTVFYYGLLSSIAAVVLYLLFKQYRFAYPRKE